MLEEDIIIDFWKKLSDIVGSYNSKVIISKFFEKRLFNKLDKDYVNSFIKKYHITDFSIINFLKSYLNSIELGYYTCLYIEMEIDKILEKKK